MRTVIFLCVLAALTMAVASHFLGGPVGLIVTFGVVCTAGIGVGLTGEAGDRIRSEIHRG